MNKEIFSAMDKIINFLSEDEKWQMQPSTNRITQGLSMQAREESIRRNIIEALRGKDLYPAQLREIANHLIYERQLSQKKSAHTNALSFLGCLIAHFPFSMLPPLSSDESCWLHAKQLLSELDNKSSSTGNISFISMDSKIDSISESIRQLRTHGYQIPIFRGHPYPAKHDTEKFMREMKLLFASMGRNAVVFALSEIKNTLNRDTGLYEMNHPMPVHGPAPIQLPYGYLLNMSLAYLNANPIIDARASRQTWEEAKLLAAHFISTFELQIPDQIEQLNMHPFYFLRELVEIAQSITLIAPEQMKAREVLSLLRLIDDRLSVDDRSEAPKSLGKGYIGILDFIVNKTNEFPGCKFTTEEICAALCKQVNNSVLIDCLNNLSLDIDKINVDYPVSIPTDANSINAYQRPLVRSGNTYFFLDANLFSVGFYAVWLRTCLKNKRVIGKLYERHLAGIFENHHVRVLSNFVYTIPESASISNADKGECDFIIDTPSEIYFIEAKAKALSARCLSGDEAELLEDVKASLLKSSTQLLKHEVYLRQLKELRSTDGKVSVSLTPGKRVVKVCLSLFNRGRMHDSLVVSRILRAVQCLCLSPVSPKFRKAQSEFIDLCKHNIIKAAYHSQDEFLRSFLSTSLPQLLFLLDGTKKHEELVEELKTLLHLSSGTQNHFTDIALHRAIQQGTKHMTNQLSLQDILLRNAIRRAHASENGTQDKGSYYREDAAFFLKHEIVAEPVPGHAKWLRFVGFTPVGRMLYLDEKGSILERYKLP